MGALRCDAYIHPLSVLVAVVVVPTTNNTTTTAASTRAFAVHCRR